MIVNGIVPTHVKVRVCKAEPWYCLSTCWHLHVTIGYPVVVRCKQFKRRLATHAYEDKMFYHRCKACCDTCKIPKP